MRIVDHWEKLSLAVVFIFSFYGHYSLFNNQLMHDIPLVYAADPTWHSMIAEYLAESGLVKYRPSNFALGRTDIEWFHPIILTHTLAAYLTQMTPLEAWDALWLVVTFAHIFLAFGVYLLIKRLFNPMAAVFSFALVSFPWSEIWLYPYTVGLQVNVAGMFYFPFLFYMGLRLKDGLCYSTAFFTGLIMTFIFFSHASEFFIIIGFYVILLAHSRLDKPLLKNMGFSFLVFLVLSFYFLPLVLQDYLFSKSSIIGSLGKSTVQPSFEPPVELSLSMVHILLLPFLFIGLKFIFDTFNSSRTRDYLLITAYVTFLAFFSNYIGLPSYANFRLRYFYYVFLYPFIGLGLSQSLNYLKTRYSFNEHAGAFALSCIIIFIPFFLLRPVPSRSIGLIDESTFEAFMFLKDQTPVNSSVLFIGFNQAEGLWSHRITYQAAVSQLQSDLETGRLSMIWTEVIPEGFLRSLPVRTGLFSVESTLEVGGFNVTMCDTDFIMFKTFGGDLNPYVGAYMEYMNETHDILFINDNAVIIGRSVSQRDCYERIFWV